MRPLLIDLYCGPGGASVGYHRAGFNTIGVDKIAQPDYPYRRTKCDALIALHRLLTYGRLETHFGPVALSDIAAFHASPPCQRFTNMQRQRKNSHSHEDLVGPTRDLLDLTGLPYVIENVEAAAPVLRDPVLICGSMFDPAMEIRWHRLFETNWGLQPPEWPCRHKLQSSRIYPGTINGSGNRPGGFVVNPFASETTHDQAAAAKEIRDYILDKPKSV